MSNKDDLKLEILKKLEEKTGLDLTDKITKTRFVCMGDDESEGSIASADTLDSLDEATPEQLQFLLDKISSASDAEFSKATSSHVLIAKEQIDGYEFRSEFLPENVLVSALKNPDPDTAFGFIYDVAEQTLEYRIADKKIEGMSFTLDFNLRTAERLDIQSAVNILIKHVDLCTPLYEYEVPSADVCEKFISVLLDTKEILNSIVNTEDDDDSEES